MMRTAFFCALSVFAAGTALLAIGSAVEAQDAGSTIERFRVAKDGDALLLPVRMDGREYLFLLDTGASITLFDSSLRLGEPIYAPDADASMRLFDRFLRFGESKATVSVATPDGRVTLPAHKTPAASLGRFRLQDSLPRIVASDLSAFRRALGHKIYGILGMDFLSAHVVHIDFDLGELRFLTAANPKAGKAIRMPCWPGRPPYFTLHVAGHGDEVFALDTGMIRHESGAISEALSAALVEKRTGRVVGTAGSFTLSGSRELNLVQGKAVDLGEFRLPNPVFTQHDANRLSLRYLSRYVVTLDFVHQRAHLRQGRAFSHPDGTDISGLHIIREDGKTIIDVDPDGPAARAGLQAGDVLLKLGDIQAEDARLFELDTVLRGEGNTIRLVARRAGNTLDASIVLKR